MIPLYYFKKRVVEGAERIFPRWGYRRGKRQWETNWAQGDYSAIWMTDRIPKQLVEAVESGWFPPGAAVLDIGCGEGDVAAWLAGRGFAAVGIDYSRSAIERAKSKHRQVRGALEFCAADICFEIPGRGRFQALLDRGCLHGIRPKFHGRYADNVASSAAAGARFLLLVATMDHPDTKDRARTATDVIRRISATFAATFELCAAEKTLMEMAPGTEPMPAVAFRLIRR